MSRLFRLLAAAALLGLAACDPGERAPTAEERSEPTQVRTPRDAAPISSAPPTLPPEPPEMGADALLPLVRILEIVRDRAPGEVLEVDLDDDEDEGPVYEITVLTPDGRVLEAVIDARDGAMLELEED